MNKEGPALPVVASQKPDRKKGPRTPPLGAGTPVHSRVLHREDGTGGEWVNGPVVTHPEKPYVLYLLECRGGRFYAGIALDAEDRFMQHLSGKGAAFTRAFEPIRILKSMTLPNKSWALKAEIALKKLPKSKKLAFFDEVWSPSA